MDKLILERFLGDKVYIHYWDRTRREEIRFDDAYLCAIEKEFIVVDELGIAVHRIFIADLRSIGFSNDSKHMRELTGESKSLKIE